MNWIVSINANVVYPIENKIGLLCVKAITIHNLPKHFDMYHIVSKPYNSAGAETYVGNVKIPCILKTFVTNDDSGKISHYFDESDYYHFNFSSVDSVEFQICDSKGVIKTEAMGYIKVDIKNMCNN